LWCDRPQTSFYRKQPTRLPPLIRSADDIQSLEGSFSFLRHSNLPRGPRSSCRQALTEAAGFPIDDHIRFFPRAFPERTLREGLSTSQTSGVPSKAVSSRASPWHPVCWNMRFSPSLPPQLHQDEPGRPVRLTEITPESQLFPFVAPRRIPRSRPEVVPRGTPARPP